MEDGHSSSIGLTPVSSTADMLPDNKAETAVARHGLSRRSSYGRERCNWPRVLEITGIVVAVAVIWMVFLQVLTAFYYRESTTTDRSISPVQVTTSLLWYNKCIFYMDDCDFKMMLSLMASARRSL